ncbi:MAG: biopolymer transporter ExbD [Planctomycetes bacterium]|nr:biopolymer transporter ExbD [Planctomycetota bacterium]MCH7872065.1 biopolymer transporter ExbD [Planctomycetota bacterium]
MLRIRTHKQALTASGFNATPMVDVIFLLTIFFMLVSRFSSAEQVPMELPKPDASRAQVTKLPDRVIINCRLADVTDPVGADVLYSIGPNRPERLDVLADRLSAMKRARPDIKAVIRADRRLHYGAVREAMRVVARSGIEMLNVVAHVAEDE